MVPVLNCEGREEWSEHRRTLKGVRRWGMPNLCNRKDSSRILEVLKN